MVSRALRDMAGMTAAWTVMGAVFTAAAVATIAVGVFYAIAAGTVAAREAATRRANRKNRG